MRSHILAIVQLRIASWLAPAAPYPADAPAPRARAAGRAGQLLGAVASRLRADLQRPEAALVPLRGFIGLGWLRAGAEKAVDPGWITGASLTAFLHQQAGQAPFPAYQWLITDLFLPHALPLSWIILIGQLLAGAAIAAGFLTRPALAGTLFMNVNFLLAGVPNPSAFYLAIQGALLASDSGGVLGVDGLLRRGAPAGAVPARRNPPSRAGQGLRLATAALLVGLAGAAAPYIRDFSPAGSVHDPAALAVIVALMAAAWYALSYVRGRLQATGH